MEYGSLPAYALIGLKHTGMSKVVTWPNRVLGD